MHITYTHLLPDFGSVVLLFLLATIANGRKYGEIDKCMIQEHDSCVNRCLETRLPVEYRSAVGNCITSSYTKWQFGFRNCLNLTDDSPCFARNFTQEKDMEHAPEQVPGPRDDILLVQLQNMDKCSKDCRKSTRDKCTTEGCDEPSAEMLLKLNSCRASLNQNTTKEVFVCVMKAAGCRKNKTTNKPICTPAPATPRPRVKPRDSGSKGSAPGLGPKILLVVSSLVLVSMVPVYGLKV